MEQADRIRSRQPVRRKHKVSDRECPFCSRLTCECQTDTLRLNDRSGHAQKDRVSLFDIDDKPKFRNPLEPLLYGNKVLLQVRSSKVFRKKRVRTLLLIIDRLDADHVLVSFPGYGAEIINLKSSKASDVALVGLPFGLAKELLVALRSTLGESDGTTEKEYSGTH